MKQLARQHWQVLRAAARVLVLFRRRRLATRSSVGTTSPTSRKPKTTPSASLSCNSTDFAQGYVALGDGGYAQKLQLFQRVLSKP